MHMDMCIRVYATCLHTGEYVAFMSYAVPSGRPVCKTCTDGSTDPKCKKKVHLFFL